MNGDERAIRPVRPSGAPLFTLALACLVGSVCAAGALLGAPVAHAQIPRSWLGRTIQEVRIEGEGESIAEVRDVGVPIGAPVSRRLLRAATLRLLRSGRWADVQLHLVPEGDEGVALVVRLVPRLLITRIDINGNFSLSDDEIRQLLGVSVEDQIEEEQLAELAEPIRSTYEERGFPDTVVRIRLRDTDDPSVKVLRVRIREGEPLRLAERIYEGEAPPRHTDIEGSFGLGVGDILDRRRLEEGIRRAERHLRERGWLEAALGAPRVERRGQEALVHLPTHLGPLYRVVIRGQEPLEEEAIRGVLHLEEERLSTPVVGAIRERVLVELRRHGFHYAEARVRRVRGVDEEAGEALLLIEIEPGEQLRVVGISFPGARQYESDFLRDQVLSYLEEDLPDTRTFPPVDSDVLDRVGVSGGVSLERRRVPQPVEINPGRVYYEPSYREAVEHLREVYDAAGFLSAQVGPVELRELGLGLAVVVVPVNEGPRTLLREVRLSGNEILSRRELLLAARLVRGEPFSYLALEEARQRILDLYRERGHIFARTEAQVRFSGDRERAVVLLRVVESFEVHIGRVLIRGAEHTDEGLIRERLGLRSGALLRPSGLRESQERLMRLGVFGSVTIAPVDPELPEQTKDLLITVSEQPPQALEWGLGVSTGQGARGHLEYSYNNLFGYAVSLRFRVQLAFQFLFQDAELERNITGLSLLDRVERRASLGLSVPHLSFLPNTRLSIDFVHLRDNQRRFGVDKNGGIVTLLWQPIRRLSVSASGELEYNAVELFGDTESLEEYRMSLPPNDPNRQVLRVPEGESALVATRLGASFDQRDNPFNPSEGFFANANAEWVTTLTTADPADFSNFLKLGLSASGYIPVFNDVVIALQVRGGGIVHLVPGSSTYPNRQYFLGGVNSLRGFLQDQVIPEDLARIILDNEEGFSANSAIVGADLFVLLRAELRFPIFGAIRGGLFADFGNLWADPQRFLDQFELRPTAGLGIRVTTPVGPIALDYGFNLVRREKLNEPFGAFHFSIGLF